MIEVVGACMASNTVHQVLTGPPCRLGATVEGDRTHLGEGVQIHLLQMRAIEDGQHLDLGGEGQVVEQLGGQHEALGRAGAACCYAQQLEHLQGAISVWASWDLPQAPDKGIELLKEGCTSCLATFALVMLIVAKRRALQATDSYSTCSMLSHACTRIASLQMA